jgi:peptidoglycan/LPS O-acetylase OafA/YrhL
VSGQPLPGTIPYALRRVLRIFPLYWLGLTAVVAIAGTAGTQGWELPIHYLLLNNLVPGRQEALFPAAWTLTLEVLFYTAVPILAVLVRRRRHAVSAEWLASMVIVSWLASIAFTSLADLLGDGQTGLWLRGSLPAMWQMFCPGIVLALAPYLRSAGWRRWLVDFPQRRVATATIVVAFSNAALLAAAAPLRFGVVPYQLLVDASRPLFAVAYGLIIARAIATRPWASRAPWILQLGLASYGIYLLHSPIADFLSRHGLSPIPDDTVPAFVVNFGLLAGLTVPLALASWYWLERPAIGLGRALGERWRAGGPATMAP